MENHSLLLQHLEEKKRRNRRSGVATVRSSVLADTIEVIKDLEARVRALEAENTMLSLSGHNMRAEHAAY